MSLKRANTWEARSSALRLAYDTHKCNEVMIGVANSGERVNPLFFCWTPATQSNVVLSEEADLASTFLSLHRHLWRAGWLSRSMVCIGILRTAIGIISTLVYLLPLLLRYTSRTTMTNYTGTCWFWWRYIWYVGSWRWMNDSIRKSIEGEWWRSCGGGFSIFGFARIKYDYYGRIRSLSTFYRTLQLYR